MIEENQTPAAPRASLGKRLLLGTVSLVLAAAAWLPAVHLCFRPPAADNDVTGVTPRARRLAARHLHLWTHPEQRQEELDKMRASNAEWDFMGRSYLVWALAEMSLRDPEKKGEYLAVMDRIIDATLQTEEEQGLYHFLMPYACRGRFVARPARSLFIDGEIALMLAVRRLVTPVGFLKAAATLAVVYLACHLLGWREHASFLSGTISSDTAGITRTLMGVLYVLAYFSFVLAVPILVLGAGIFAVLLHVLGSGRAVSRQA